MVEIENIMSVKKGKKKVKDPSCEYIVKFPIFDFLFVVDYLENLPGIS